MSAKAYGSITITDLLDTATYIYYAETNSSDSDDWHIEATEDDKYIGIYSGPPASGGQPAHPTEDIFTNLVISKFVGEDGENGTPGADAVLYSLTCTAGSLISYQSQFEPNVISFKAYSKTGALPPSAYSSGYLVVAQSSDGENYSAVNSASNSSTITCSTSIFSANTKFIRCNLHPNNLLTTSILAQQIIPVLTNGSDRYMIESSDEVIYKFYLSSGQKQYSPSSVSFRVRAIGASSSELLVPYTGSSSDYDYDHELELVGSTEQDYQNLWRFFARIYGYIEGQATYTQVTINATQFNANKTLYYTYNSSTQTYTQCVETDTYNSNINYFTIVSHTVLDLVRTISDNVITFNLENLSKVVAYTSSDADAQAFEALRQMLYNHNYWLNFKIFKPSNNAIPQIQDFLAYKTLGIEFGTSEDMAQFRLTANSIQQLIGDHSLVFDANGLHIYNGAFDINNQGYYEAFPTEAEFNANPTHYYTYNATDSVYQQCSAQEDYNSGTQYYVYDTLKLLEYDPYSESLRIRGSGTFTGNGTFSGTIYASEGSFNGTITAKEGEIGGWIILDNGLFSTNGAVITDGVVDITNSAIKLDSMTGHIYASSITLGKDAAIEDYLQLGTAYLLNPNSITSNGINNYYTNYVLLAGKQPEGDNPYVPTLKLRQDGFLQLGSITLDGSSVENSSIYGSNWYINPSFASFNNVNVSGKIVTSIFEIGKTSMVGGSMLFKASYRVLEYGANGSSGYYVRLENGKDAAAANDYFVFIDAKGTLLDGVYKVNSYQDAGNDGDIILTTLPTVGTQNSIYSAAKLGQIGDIIIGINSEDNTNNLFKARGLTISEFNIDSNNSLANEVKVFLGDLSRSGIYGTSGFGLYSNNVYLTGSLVTKISTNDKYAGVNTLDGTTAEIFGDRDRSPIVFWAGSITSSPGDIQNAPFQVTSNGYLYAQYGEFKDAIITDSDIRGADIYAARIHGIGRDSNSLDTPGLSIYDTDNAIAFYTYTYTGHGVGHISDFTEYYYLQQSTGMYLPIPSDMELDPAATIYSRTPKEVFRIGTYGFYFNNIPFIDFTNDEVSVTVTNFISANTYTNRTTGLQFTDNGIYKLNNAEKTTNVSFTPTSINMGVGNNNDPYVEGRQLEITTNTISLNTTNTKVFANMILGDDTVVMKYQKVANGYDLYIATNGGQS